MLRAENEDGDFAAQTESVEFRDGLSEHCSDTRVDGIPTGDYLVDRAV